MKKFLSTVLTIYILALPVGLQCLASENGSIVRDSYLVENEDAIKRDLKNLTGFETTNLLYRASRDGFDPDNFYEKCEGHSNTVVIIKVNGGDLIGGYVSIPWFTAEADSEESEFLDGYDKDENAFLFSLTKEKIYPIKKGKEGKAIYSYYESCHGPIFGSDGSIFGSDLCIIDNNEDAFEEYCEKNNIDDYYNKATTEKFLKEGYRSSCSLGMPNRVYESNGDNCGTFLGFEPSEKVLPFNIEDYEVYEVEKTVANNSVCGGHPRKARVNIEDGSICWPNVEGSHDGSRTKRKFNDD